ncbi:MAG TPA: hypothetical protein VGN07_22630 [Steroidobacteraceae bacterium]|jgi:hypothetical protein
MLKKIGPGLDTEADILKQAAEVLEIGYRKDLRETIFRNFKGVRCAITGVVSVEETLVKVLEDCTLRNGQISKEHLFVAQTKNGWRVIAMPAES